MIHLLLPLLALAPQDAAGAQGAPSLILRSPEVEDLELWRAHVRPTAGELAFEQIDWIPDFADGIRRASAEGRPLLFWAMNGHPLACT